MKQCRLVLVGLILSSTHPSAAEVVYSTFEVGDSYDIFNGVSLGGPASTFAQGMAQQFVPSASVYLDSVDVALSKSFGTSIVSVSVLADDAGSPGDELAAVDVNGFADGIVTAQFNSALVLHSGMNYWLGVFTPGSNEATWHDSLQSGFALQGYSEDTGVTWVTTSSDPFPPAAMRVNGAPPTAPDIIFIDEGQAWRFVRGLAEPSTGITWTTVGFDDTSWDFGLEGFGYDADPVTQAGLMSLVRTDLSDMQDNGVNPNAYTSVYLRRTFSVDVPAALTQLILQLDYDDSFVAYINGVEVARSDFGTPGIPAEFDEMGVLHESTNGDPHRAPGRFTVDLINDFPGSLQAGADNVLAIHGLNASLEDDDFLLARISLGAHLDIVNSADFDSDGGVDSADLAIWQAAFGVNALADADGDGDSDGRDFLEWQRQYGSGVDSLAISRAVPEPGIILLFAATLPLARSRTIGLRRYRSA